MTGTSGTSTSPARTTTIVAPPGTHQIVIERVFDAPRELVYRAYTEPELLVRWLGPRDLTMTVDRFDLRAGGSWRYVHTAQDGTEHGFHGVFHGESSLDATVQTFEYEGAPGHVSLDSLALIEQEGRTLVRSTSVFQSVEARDAMLAAGMGGGVIEGHERLDELIAQLA